MADVEFDEHGFPAGARPLCPFCSAPWGDDAIRLFNLDAGDQCQSGRFEPENCTVSIICDRCGREMYRKEGHAIDF